MFKLFYLYVFQRIWCAKQFKNLIAINLPIFLFNFFFQVDFFYLLDLMGILNVTYLAIYQGTEGELVKIDIQWKDEVSLYSRPSLLSKSL